MSRVAKVKKRTDIDNSKVFKKMYAARTAQRKQRTQQVLDNLDEAKIDPDIKHLIKKYAMAILK